MGPSINDSGCSSGTQKSSAYLRLGLSSLPQSLLSSGVQSLTSIEQGDSKHRTNSGQDQHERILEVFMSDDFLSGTRVRSESGLSNAQAFFFAATYLANIYEERGDLHILERAIVLVEYAIDHPLTSELELEKYMLMYVQLLQLVTQRSATRANMDKYIAGLEKQIKTVSEEDLKTYYTHRIGPALVMRFYQNGDLSDLKSSVGIMLKCFTEQNSDDLPIDLLIYLADALNRSFQEYRRLSALMISIDVSWHALIHQSHYGKEGFDDLCTEIFKNFVAACHLLCNDPTSGPEMDLLLKYLSLVTDNALANAEVKGFLALFRIRALMKQHFEFETMVNLSTVAGDLVERVGAEELAEIQRPISANTGWEPQLSGRNVFKHHRMIDEKRNIRLLYLLPGHVNDCIQCEVREMPFSEITEYEALSYVWGDQVNLIAIQLNEDIHMVTNTLHFALRRLRHPSRTKVLWIDAICIDQVDGTEKMHQISLMREIYSRAASVILWLNEPPSPEPHFDFDRRRDIRAVPEGQTPVGSDHVRTAPYDVFKSDSTHGQLFELHNTTDRESKERTSFEETTEEFDEAFQTLLPLLFGHKPAMMSPLPTLDDNNRALAFKLMEKISQQSEVKILLQNYRMRRIDGPELRAFDWTSDEKIPTFFQTPMDRKMWPVLGAFSLIYLLARGCHFDELPFFARKEDKPNFNLAYHPSITWMKSAETLTNVLKARYWDRAWILQEIVLAKQPILYYGSHRMLFDEFVQAQKNFKRHYERCCSRWGDQAYQKVHTHWTAINDGLQKLERIQALRDAHSLRQKSDTAAFSDNIKKSPKSLRLANLMQLGAKTRQSSDPRDMVYGLLGLAKYDHGLFEADYALSTSEVFANAAHRCLEEEQDFGLLLYSYQHSVNLGLPSWVPDWTATHGYAPIYHEWSLFAVGGFNNFYAKSINTDIKSGLEVQAVLINRIASVSDMRVVPWSAPHKLVTQLFEWRRMAGLQGTEAGEYETENTSIREDGSINIGDSEPDMSLTSNMTEGQGVQADQIKREQEFWRAMFTDAIVPSSSDPHGRSSSRLRRFELADFDRIRAWWRWLQSEAVTYPGSEWFHLYSGSQSDDSRVILSRFSTATEMRKLFFTSTGQIGTGPASFPEMTNVCADVAVGDEVHVVSGCNLPIILRPMSPDIGGLQEVSRPASPRYTFIGMCYLDGIMDGAHSAYTTSQKRKIWLC